MRHCCPFIPTIHFTVETYPKDRFTGDGRDTWIKLLCGYTCIYYRLFVTDEAMQVTFVFVSYPNVPFCADVGIKPITVPRSSVIDIYTSKNPKECYQESKLCQRM